MRLNDLSGQPIHRPDGEQIRKDFKIVYGGELEAVIADAEERMPGTSCRKPAAGIT